MNGWVSRGIVTMGLAVALGLAPCDGVPRCSWRPGLTRSSRSGRSWSSRACRPDLGPVSVRVSFGLTLPPNGHLEDMRQDLYLLWPAEVADGSAPGASIRAPRVRGASAASRWSSEGRLALAVRDRAKLGTPAPSDPLPESAPFVTFYKVGTNPAQAGVGTLVRSRGRPASSIRSGLLSVSAASKDLITPKAATWLEELFWGRRHVLSLSAGQRRIPGALLDPPRPARPRDPARPGLLDPRRRVRRLRSPPHRGDQPPAATRRPSRVRAGAETVGLALGAGEDWCPRC